MAVAAIIGGGIGGLTAAIALQRRGMEAIVYEAAPELQAVGAGIWVPTNAMQALERLGVSDAVAARGVALARIEVHDARAGIIHTVDLGGVRKQFGHTTVALHRAALQQVLAGALAPGTLQLGKTCTGFSTDGRRVCVRFGDATEVQADILIGADGLHSTIRRALFPEVVLRYSGQTCYRGIAAAGLPPDLYVTCREVWGGRVRFGFSAIASDRVYWFAPVLGPAGGRDAPGTARSTLAALYARFPAPIPALVAGTEENAILRTDLFDFVPLARWWRDNVVLLGDAAHATTPNLGQGGAQAIEDAFVLAECLARRFEPRAAFAAYERARLPKARRVVNVSRHFGALAHLQSPWARRLRNAVLRALPSAVNRRQLEALYRLSEP